MKIMRVVLLTLVMVASLLVFSTRQKDDIGPAQWIASDMFVPFVENKGQIDPDILYYTQTAMNHVHLGVDANMALIFQSGNTTVRERYPGRETSSVFPVDPMDTKLNIIQSGETYADIRCYRGLRLMSVAHHINLSVVVQKEGLEKIYEIMSGASPDDLVITLEGGTLSIDREGNLVVEGETPFVFSRPVAYQHTMDGLAEVDVSYMILDDQSYQFSVGAYDTLKPLYIDPLISSTYLGTSSKDNISGIEVDPIGNVIVSGTTEALDFPFLNGYMEESQGGQDLFVAKFTPDLSTLIAATYIGGQSHDTLDDMALDIDGNIILAGRTWSRDLLSGVSGHHTTYTANRDGFVIKLSNDMDQILAGTYIGGSHEDLISAIAVDASSIRVTGSTYSTDLFMLDGSHATSGLSTEAKSGFYIAFDVDLMEVIGSTYINGHATSNMACDDIVIDSDGHTIISGRVIGGNNTGAFEVTSGAIDYFGTTRGLVNFVRSYNMEGSVLNASGRFIHYMWATSFGVNNSMPYPTMMAINDNDELYISSHLHNAGSSTTDTMYMLKIDNTLSAASAIYTKYSQQSAFNFTEIAVNPKDQLPYATGHIHKNSFPFMHPGFYYEGRKDYVGTFITQVEPNLVLSDAYVAQPVNTTYNVPGTLSERSALYLSMSDFAADQWQRLECESPSIAFDSEGDIYLAFSTNGNAFSIPETRAYQIVNLGNNDIYIVHLTPALNGSLDPSENFIHDYASSITLDTSDDIHAGDEVTLIHTLENLGPDHGNDVTVTITVDDPAAISSVTVTDSGIDTHTIDGNIITLHLKDVGLGIRETMIKLGLDEGFTGTLEVASLSSVERGTDDVFVNNTDAVTFDVLEPIMTSDLFVTGTAYEQSEALGTYTANIRFGNNGPNAANDVTVSVTLDSNTSLVSAYPDTHTISFDEDENTVVTWGPMSLESGEENAEEGDDLNQHRVTVSLNDPNNRGTLLKADLSISSSNLDDDLVGSNSENNKTLWFGNLPGLSLEIHGPEGLDSASIYTGETIGYDVILENNGTVEAHDISLSLSYIPAYFDIWSFEAFDQSQNNLTPDVTLYPQDEALILLIPILEVNQKVTLSAEGALSSYCEPDNFVYPVTAIAKGKSQADFLTEDLQTITTFDIFVQRPDLIVGINYTDPDVVGAVLNSKSEKTLLELDISVVNIGRGDARPFVVNVTFDDPSTSIFAVESITPTGAISDIHMTGDMNFEIVFSNHGDMVGLYGTDATGLHPGEGEGHVRLVIETQASGFGFDTAWIDVEIVFEDILDIGSDSDLSSNEDTINIEFIVFKYDIDLVGNITTTALGSYVRQTYLITFVHQSTDWKRTPLDLLGIEIDFSYLDNRDVLNLYLETVTTMPDFEVIIEDNILSLINVDPIVTDQIFHVFVQYEVPVGEIDTLEYAKNDFELWTDVYYMTEDSAKLHEFEHLHTWQLPVQAPVITSPMSGQVCFMRGEVNHVIDVEGYTAPYTTVIFYDENNQFIDTTISDELGKFSIPLTPSDTPSFYAIASRNDVESIRTPLIELSDSSHSFCPQTSYWAYDRNDAYFIYKFVENDTGLYTTSGWVVNGFYGFIDTMLVLDVCCPNPKSLYVIADNVMYDDPTIVAGMYVFEIGKAHHVLIHVDCEDGKETDSSGTVLIDPDGYVYNAAIGFSNVVPGAIVTCYVYDAVNDLWTEWMAASYNNQVNPQTVNETGYFAFFTPPGTYRLVASGPDGYQTWTSSDIHVIDRLVTVNIPYTPMPEGEPDHVIHVDTSGLSDPLGSDMSNVTIETGDVIEWISHADASVIGAFIHPMIRVKSMNDVSTDISGFDSGLLVPDASYIRQFNHPGIYTYTFNDGDQTMTGTITVVGGKPVDTLLPTAPDDLALFFVRLGGKIKLTWEAASDNVGVAKYMIYRSVDSAPFTAIGEASDTTFTDKDVSCERHVSYFVVAIDTTGNISHHSEVASMGVDAMGSSLWLVVAIIIGVVTVVLTIFVYVIMSYPESPFVKRIQAIFKKKRPDA